MGRSSWLAVGLGLVLTAAAAAEDAYTIKIKEPGKGDVLQFSYDDTTESQSKYTDPAGKVVFDNKAKSQFLFTYQETILEREPGKHRASRLRRHYDKAQVVKNGTPTDLPYQGKTVLIEKEGKAYHFRIEGGEELKPEEAGPLNQQFNADPDEQFDLQTAILPKKPVALNETWQLDLKPLLDFYRKATGMEFDAAKAVGTGKLVKVYDLDGARFGVLRLRLELPITGFAQGDKKQAVEAGAKWTLDMTLDGCIDGSRADGGRKTTSDINAVSLVPTPDGQQGKQTVSVHGTSSQEGKEVQK